LDAYNLLNDDAAGRLAGILENMIDPAIALGETIHIVRAVDPTSEDSILADAAAEMSLSLGIKFSPESLHSIDSRTISALAARWRTAPGKLEHTGVKLEPIATAKETHLASALNNANTKVHKAELIQEIQKIRTSTLESQLDSVRLQLDNSGDRLSNVLTELESTKSILMGVEQALAAAPVFNLQIGHRFSYRGVVYSVTRHG
jgi:hypothetical protein